MVRPNPIQSGVDFGSLPLAIALFVSVSALVALCAKHARHAAKKHAAAETNNAPKLAPSSPAKKLLTTISNKATPSLDKKKGSSETESYGVEVEEAGFGEGGLWQKTILMGEKCQPPEFSGVIFYDGYGKRLSELPRSPRASPLPSFSFPVAKEAN